MPGILTSRIARSGQQVTHEVDRLVAAPGLADDLVALFLEGLAQVHPDDGLVLGDHDSASSLGAPFNGVRSPSSVSGRSTSGVVFPDTEHGERARLNR